MRCLEPSDTSSLVETMKVWWVERENQINLKTQGDPKVSYKIVVNSQWRRHRIWSRSIEDLWRKKQGLGFPNNHPYIYTFWVGEAVQWKFTWSMEGTHRQIWGFIWEKIDSKWSD